MPLILFFIDTNKLYAEEKAKMRMATIKGTHHVPSKLQESKKDHAKNCRFPPNLLNK